jgi:hypothetical protein
MTRRKQGGLDGILSPVVTHNMGAAFMQYA